MTYNLRRRIFKKKKKQPERFVLSSKAPNFCFFPIKIIFYLFLDSMSPGVRTRETIALNLEKQLVSILCNLNCQFKGCHFESEVSDSSVNN